jgi:hypothetical protein
MLNSNNSSDEPQNLVNHLTEKKWREKFLQAVNTINSADELLLLMKQKLDTLAARDEKIQGLLAWINQKSNSVEDAYNPSVVRAFYLAIVRVLYLDFSSAFEDPTRGRTPARNFATRFVRSRDLMDSQTFEPSVQLSFGFDPAGVIASLLTLDLEPELTRAIQELESQIPDPTHEKEKFDEWRKAHGKAWVVKLEDSIGYGLQFNEQQKKSLKEYYYAHNLLVDCLKSASNVTPEARQTIENTLLLPNE